MKSFKGKAIYQPSGKASEYASWACNFYVGCSNGCTYCYCKKGILAGAMGQDKPQLKKCFKNEQNAFEIFKKEMNANAEQLREHGLFFSFSTDPLLPECSDLTWEAVMEAMENDIPVKLLTKMAGNWVNQIADNMHQSWGNFIAFGFTLTGHDELEPNAYTNAERIAAMEKLHNAGFKTFASIEPIIDFESSAKIIVGTFQFCDLYKIGLMSGIKSDTWSTKNFVINTNSYLKNNSICKIYWKDSLLKSAGITRAELPENCVNSDYNLFYQ